MADTLIMRRGLEPRVALTAWLVWCGYTVYAALSAAEVPAPAGYLVNQLLMSAAIFGRLAVVIVGAYLGSRDDVWNTWGLRVTGWQRAPLAANRILLLWAVCVGSVVALVGVGGLADTVAGIGAWGPSQKSAVAVVATTGQLVLWATIALAVAGVSRSFVAGGGGVIAFAMLEMVLGRYLPPGLLRLLPGWNGSVVLERVFADQGGFLSVGTVHGGSLAASLVVLAAYFAISNAVCVLTYSRREV